MFAEPCEAIDLGTYPDQAVCPPWGYFVEHVTHAGGAKAMANSLNLRDFERDDRGAGVDDFPESIGLAWSSVRLSDHTGSRIDPPYH